MVKTVADLKRTLKVGTKVHCFHVLHNKDMGVRSVVKMDTVKVGFLTPEGQTSFLNWPKAIELQAHEDGKGFDVLRNYSLAGEAPKFETVLSYRFVG